MIRTQLLIKVSGLAVCLTALTVCAAEPLRLENNTLALRFDATSGTLTAVENKLTGETYAVSGDEFAIEAVEFGIEFGKTKLAAVKQSGGTLDARYEADGMTVEVTYALRGENHFAEKQVTLTATRNYGLKKLVLSRPAFAAGVQIVPYRYSKHIRLTPGEEPNGTFFGRTAKGGLFTGVEMPFDASTASGQQITLGYAPSLKVAAGERLACEPVYLGVYRRGPLDKEEQNLPLQSESEAMVAMTSAILGPPRFGLVPSANGWHSQMEHGSYTEESVAGDIKSLDFLAECGIDWCSSSHPWEGETAKMNSLVDDQKYEPGPLVRQFLEHAQQVGVKIVMWPTMNNTHPFLGQAGGKPFRPDKPEWLMRPFRNANCMGCAPFVDWLTQVNLQGLRTGYYKSWAMDGDFFGGSGGGKLIPVKCPSDQHRHLPGDSNYACQRALAQLTAAVRTHFPETYIFMCRPPQDLGIWSLRNVDVCFTLLEFTPGQNLVGGDRIREWSRIRLHREFLPHYLDQPLLFPSHEVRPAPWPREHLDYILLSALSSSPNQHYYLPTKTGMPDADKAELRKWLDWGRKNIAYLQVRKDLADWPAVGKVDGSAHIVGDRGLVFLFNPNKTALCGEFPITEEAIGLKGTSPFSITQEHPAAGRTQAARAGETVRWEVPAQTAVVLRIQPAAR
jgi:hypothetical protein